MPHDLHFGTVHFDFARVGAVRGIRWVGGANVGDFEHHVRLFIAREAVPEGDADVLHAVSAEVGVLEEVWVDGDLADMPGVVGDSTCRLVREVVDARVPSVGDAGGGVELTFGEEAWVAVVHAAKGDVNGSSAVDGAGNVGHYRWLAVFFGHGGVVEAVWCYANIGDVLERRIRAREDDSFDERRNTKEEC